MHQRYMLIFKIDAANLIHRIHARRQDYIEAFSLKRDRNIFTEVFRSRYAEASAYDLSHCSQEVITTLDQFYSSVDELHWYLKHTQDMPTTIEDEVMRKVSRLKRLHQTLDLHLEAELTGVDIEALSQNIVLEEVEEEPGTLDF